MADRTDQRPTSARIALPGRPASVATARRFIEARNAAWSFPEPAGAKLVLIGSELVTNAILHARTELTLTLELRDGRVRISVKDRSRSAAALRHYQADALTGRGLGVVAALSDSWGISATAAGKVVWAEVAASGNAAGTGAQRPPEEVGRLPAAPPAAVEGLRTVRFPAVPVDRYLALQAHNDALFRELELISIELERGAGGRVAPGPGRAGRPALLALPGPARQLPRRGRRAQARGEPAVDLETKAPPSAAGAALGYLELLERADELCRAGVLLTPEPPPEVKDLRRWFVEEMVAQL